jgi:putative tryptophan/tyrosine transport system substrate-binding protein
VHKAIPNPFQSLGLSRYDATSLAKVEAMRRRQFIMLLGGAAAAWPFAAHAQQAGAVRRVGIVMPFARGDAEYSARVRAFLEELEKLGWHDGRNIRFDERWTTDNMDIVRAEATSLMASNPDVILAIGGRVIPVLMQLSHSIPIVIAGASDPVGVGWVTSLAHPGGNVTGFTSIELSILGKSLEILKQIVPGIARVAMAYNPDNPNTVFYRRTFENAAGPLGIEPIATPIHGLADIERAVTSLADQQNTGIFFPGDVTTTALRDDIVALVARGRLPAIYSETAFVKVGGLASYSADRIDLFRRSAGYVDRILRGEKAGDLPFQQPIAYEFKLNLKTAKALGFSIPQSLLATADEVIE